MSNYSVVLKVASKSLLINSVIFWRKTNAAVKLLLFWTTASRVAVVMLPVPREGRNRNRVKYEIPTVLTHLFLILFEIRC